MRAALSARFPVVLVLGLVLGLGLGLGCQPSAGPADVGAPLDAGLVDTPAPDVTAVDAGPPGCVGSLDPIVCSGAVDPTTLGTGIEEVEAGLAGGTAGSHWFCEPGEGTPWNDRVLFYLVGTYGDPAGEHNVPARACELGFVAIAPMYENRDMARSVCGDDGPCYEAFHVEITDGSGDVAPDPVRVDVASSIRNRVATLLEHLASTRDAPWTTVRDRLAADDWSSVALAGHSQGAGHVAYLAREESAERMVLLAGPSDRIGNGTPTHAPAPWIAALAAAPLRTTLRLAYMHDDDDFEIVPQVIDNWDLMGIEDGTCPQATAGGYAGTCRRIRTTTDSCTGLASHLTPILERWGARCRTGAEHANRATWDHLLLVE